MKARATSLLQFLNPSSITPAANEPRQTNNDIEKNDR